MYSTEKFTKEIAVKDYIRDYVNVAEFLEYCKQCPNYGTVWSCPPYDFDAADFWTPYETFYITATKINFAPGTTLQESGEIMQEVKEQMSRELYELEERYPGSVSLSAGCCRLCRPDGCGRASGLSCRYPQKMRYSIESLGGNVGLTVSKLMGIELEWVTEGKLPSYFVLVGGLLKGREQK